MSVMLMLPQSYSSLTYNGRSGALCVSIENEDIGGLLHTISQERLIKITSYK